MIDAPTWTVRFDTAAEARGVARGLGLFGIGTVVAGELRRRGDWVEVTIVELPAQWIHAPSVVAREPFTSAPHITEVDEHDIGRSSWWDRDE